MKSKVVDEGHALDLAWLFSYPAVVSKKLGKRCHCSSLIGSKSPTKPRNLDSIKHSTHIRAQVLM